MKNHISSSAIIGRVKLGKNIYIGNNSVIGTQPQYVGFNKNKILSTKFKNLIIADDVVIMDLCHIHAGIKRNTKRNTKYNKSKRIKTKHNKYFKKYKKYQTNTKNI